MLNRMAVPALVLGLVMLVLAPFFIAAAPYESTMGLVQKIFYLHLPSWIAMFLAIFACGIASIRFLWTRRQSADHVALAAAELALLFGAIGLMTGPMWARKAWGVWWEWDVRLTSALVLWMIFAAYGLLRRFGGPGSERLAAGVAIFGMANVPFVYWSANLWRTMHPKTTVLPTLVPAMMGPMLWCVGAFLVLFIVLLAARVRIAEQESLLDDVMRAREA